MGPKMGPKRGSPGGTPRAFSEIRQSKNEKLKIGFFDTKVSKNPNSDAKNSPKNTFWTLKRAKKIKKYFFGPQKISN